MKCATCGRRYRKDDAVVEFNDFFGGIDYDSDGPGDRCGDCSIEWMKAKIRGQDGYCTDDGVDPNDAPWQETGGHPGPCALCGEDDGCIHQPWQPSWLGR